MPLNRFRIRLPSLLAGRYVRYVTGFGVAVGVGMAPFLGKYKIALFESLLELFPEDSKRSLIPISAFLMGLVAVAVQFYSGEVILRESIRRRFTFGFAVILLAFVGLVILYQPKHVLPVPDPLTLLTLLIVVFLGGIYALLKVPALTSHIFSGMSGLNSGAIVEYFLQ